LPFPPPRTPYNPPCARTGCDRDGLLAQWLATVRAVCRGVRSPRTGRGTLFMTSPASDSPSSGSADSPGTISRRLARGAGVIVISGVMFTFISYWRTAAVVLCELASTAYYIGAIVEQSIGPAAPWFILAGMCFSYAVRR